ncbi:unnamed protein product [Clavelina lepadiformis]
MNVQECSLNTTTYPSINFTCDDSSCEFNSAGTLSCAEGFTTGGVNTTSTTCLANATLSNLDVLSCAAITTTTVTSTAATTVQVTTTPATTSTVVAATAVITQSLYFCNAQTFSPLTTSSAVRAIGSDVEITTTVTTTSDFTATWRIETTPIAAAAVLVGTGATNAAVTSGTSYESRLAVSVGSYTSNQFTTTLTIQGLLATDNGATVHIGSGVSFVTSLQLNVQEAFLLGYLWETIELVSYISYHLLGKGFYKHHECFVQQRVVPLSPAVGHSQLKSGMIFQHAVSIIAECSLNTTAYPSLTFTCDDSSCEFNSAGTLSCAEGFTTSGVSTTLTTCQANATLTNLDVLACTAITCQGSDAEDNDTDVCLVNQTLVSTTFSYNDTISVQCCEGFEGSGPVDRTCDESSGWTSVDLGCTAITTTTVTSTAATTLQGVSASAGGPHKMGKRAACGPPAVVCPPLP